MTTVRGLVAELDSAGGLPDGFGALLEAVPRERFVPDRVWVDGGPVDREAEPVRWSRAVYGDEAIVTQYDGERTVWPEMGRVPICSALRPSVVVGMLDALDVQPGQRVLEVGTGTGFTTALLAEMVGASGRVVTVEADHELARAAEQRLASYGGRVRTVTGDGGHGVTDGAPYDRIIATTSVHIGCVPYAWIEQTRAGGVVVAPVRADLAPGPVVAFTVHGDGTATGRTLPASTETRRMPSPASDCADWEHSGRITTIEPWPMLELPSPRWALAVAVPSCRYDVVRGRLAWLGDPVSGSWAAVTPLRDREYMVRQGGMRHLWDEAEAAYRWWLDRGKPLLTEWRWTIVPGRQSVGLGVLDGTETVN